MTPFCLSLGFLIIPLVVPVSNVDHGIPPAYQGILLAAPNLLSALLVPVLNWGIPRIGLENSILYSNITFVFGCLILGASICFENVKVYIVGTTLGYFLMSSMYFTNLTAEGVILLKYSTANERE